VPACIAACETLILFVYRKVRKMQAPTLMLISSHVFTVGATLPWQGLSHTFIRLRSFADVLRRREVHRYRQPNIFVASSSNSVAAPQSGQWRRLGVCHNAGEQGKHPAADVFVVNKLGLEIATPVSEWHSVEESIQVAEIPHCVPDIAFPTESSVSAPPAAESKDCQRLCVCNSAKRNF